MKLSLLAIILAAAQTAQAGGIKVHGHRGCRGVRPENTLAAFEEALRAGVDVLELDMGVTKDDVIIVSHNQEVPPELCLGPGGAKMTAPIPIHSLTLAELKAFDCGSLQNPRFPRQVPIPGQTMPTLAEVFELVERSTYPAAAKVEFNIETKINPGLPDLSPGPKRFAELVAAVVKSHRLEKRVILQSFDHRTLVAMRRILPGVRLSALTSDNWLDYVLVTQGLGARILSPDQSWITKGDVKALHKAGVQVAPWTANEEKDWERLADMGVDAIITDYPADLLDWLRRRGLR